MRRSRALGLVLALAPALGSGLAGCDGSADPAEPPDPPDYLYQTVQVAALKGPTAMGLARLISQETVDHSLASHQPYLFELSLHGAADEITPGLVTGDTRLAAIPANLAAVLYAKGAPIQVAAVNTLGVLHVVTKGVEIGSLADLEGRTIYSTGKGTTPQYVLEHLLAAHGVAAQVEYLSEASEVAARVAATAAIVAVLPEPYVTTVLAQDPAAVAALDLTAEWDKVSDTQLVTGVLVVADSLLEAEPETVGVFLEEYRASVDYANAHPAEAGALIADLGIVPSAEVAAAAIPRSHLVCLTGAEAEKAVAGYLAVLYDANPASVGGALPDAGFYWG
jgi:NitT/TauT family transport system substrate-binding protein